MLLAFTLITVFTAVAFLFYGLSCLYQDRMRHEFNRFGLTSNQRLTTGMFQIVGATGLFIGLWFVEIGIIAAAGLAVMMLMGWIVRLRIKDGMIRSAPAFIFMIINGWLAYQFFILK